MDGALGGLQGGNSHVSSADALTWTEPQQEVKRAGLKHRWQTADQRPPESQQEQTVPIVKHLL